MRFPEKQADGTIRVPVVDEDPETGLIMDGWAVLEPGTEQYRQWLPFMAATKESQDGTRRERPTETQQ